MKMEKKNILGNKKKAFITHPESFGLNNLKKVFFMAIYTLVFLFIILAAMIIFTTPKHESPSIFGYHVFVVKSDSMLPTIQQNTLIIAKDVPYDSLKKGDIISFISSDPAIINQINTHRIQHVNENYVITKGDHNPTVDEYPVYEDQVIAKEVAMIPYVGILIHFFQSPYGFIGFIVPLIIIFLIYFKDFVNVYLEYKNEKNKNFV